MLLLMALPASLSLEALHSLSTARKLLMVPALRQRGIQLINRAKSIREESSLSQTQQMAGTQLMPRLCSVKGRQNKRCKALQRNDEPSCCAKPGLLCCLQISKATDIDDIFQKGKGSKAKAGLFSLGAVAGQRPIMQLCHLHADICSS